MRIATVEQRASIRARREARKAEMAALSAKAKSREAQRVNDNRAKVAAKLNPVIRKNRKTQTDTRPTVIIGIDPGTKTGVGIYQNGELVAVETTTIVEAIERVAECHETANVTVYIEDSRMATYGRRGKQSTAQAQGAGSIKRDCSIWETEMKRRGIPYKMVRPNKQGNAVAENKALWVKLTGWEKRCSVHARDAVMIGRRFVNVKMKAK